MPAAGEKPLNRLGIWSGRSEGAALFRGRLLGTGIPSRRSSAIQAFLNGVKTLKNPPLPVLSRPGGITV